MLERKRIFNAAGFFRERRFFVGTILSDPEPTRPDGVAEIHRDLVYEAEPFRTGDYNDKGVGVLVFDHLK